MSQIKLDKLDDNYRSLKLMKFSFENQLIDFVNKNKIEDIVSIYETNFNDCIEIKLFYRE